MGSDNPNAVTSQIGAAVDDVFDELDHAINQPINDFFDPDSGNTPYNPEYDRQRALLPKPPDPTDPPSAADARNKGFTQARDGMKRRRAASTLMTSGTGAIDRPSTASTVLLGS